MESEIFTRFNVFADKAKEVSLKNKTVADVFSSFKMAYNENILSLSELKECITGLRQNNTIKKIHLDHLEERIVAYVENEERTELETDLQLEMQKLESVFTNLSDVDVSYSLEMQEDRLNVNISTVAHLSGEERVYPIVFELENTGNREQLKAESMKKVAACFKGITEDIKVNTFESEVSKSDNFDKLIREKFHGILEDGKYFFIGDVKYEVVCKDNELNIKRIYFNYQTPIHTETIRTEIDDYGKIQFKEFEISHPLGVFLEKNEDAVCEYIKKNIDINESKTPKEEATEEYKSILTVNQSSEFGKMIYELLSGIEIIDLIDGRDKTIKVMFNYVDRQEKVFEVISIDNRISIKYEFGTITGSINNGDVKFEEYQNLGFSIGENNYILKKNSIESIVHKIKERLSGKLQYTSIEDSTSKSNESIKVSKADRTLIGKRDNFEYYIEHNGETARLIKYTESKNQRERTPFKLSEFDFCVSKKFNYSKESEPINMENLSNFLSSKIKEKGIFVKYIRENIELTDDLKLEVMGRDLLLYNRNGFVTSVPIKLETNVEKLKIILESKELEGNKIIDKRLPNEFMLLTGIKSYDFIEKLSDEKYEELVIGIIKYAEAMGIDFIDEKAKSKFVADFLKATEAEKNESKSMEEILKESIYIHIEDKSYSKNLQEVNKEPLDKEIIKENVVEDKKASKDKKVSDKNTIENNLMNQLLLFGDNPSQVFMTHAVSSDIIDENQEKINEIENETILEPTKQNLVEEKEQSTIGKESIEPVLETGIEENKNIDKTKSRRTIYNKIYDKLNKVLNGKLEILMSSEEDFYFKIKNDVFMPLSVTKEYWNCLSFSHTYIENGDLMFDTSIDFEIDLVNKSAEAIAWVNPLNQERLYSVMYDSDGKRKMNTSLHKDNNYFANSTFLPNLQSQRTTLSQKTFEAIEISEKLIDELGIISEKSEVKEKEIIDKPLDIYNKSKVTDETKIETPKLIDVKPLSKNGIRGITIDSNKKYFTAGERHENNELVKHVLEKQALGIEFNEEDYITLKNYSGVGNLRQEINAEDAMDKSITTEFYTDTARTNFISKFATHLGLEEDMYVLEPSCGNGNMLYSLPDGVKVLGVEINKLSSNIAKSLYPDATIYNCPFEVFTTQDKRKVDFCVGNPPFGKRNTLSKKYFEKGQTNYEEIFVTEQVRKLKDNGYMINVLPVNIIDRLITPKTAAVLDRETELVAIIRFDRGSFSHANTDVQTDIAIFRKLIPEEFNQRESDKLLVDKNLKAILTNKLPDKLKAISFSLIEMAGTAFLVMNGKVVTTVELKEDLELDIEKISFSEYFSSNSKEKMFSLLNVAYQDGIIFDRKDLYGKVVKNGEFEQLSAYLPIYFMEYTNKEDFYNNLESRLDNVLDNFKELTSGMELKYIKCEETELTDPKWVNPEELYAYQRRELQVGDTKTIENNQYIFDGKAWLKTDEITSLITSKLSKIYNLSVDFNSTPNMREEISKYLIDENEALIDIYKKGISDDSISELVSMTKLPEIRIHLIKNTIEQAKEISSKINLGDYVTEQDNIGLKLDINKIKTICTTEILSNYLKENTISINGNTYEKKSFFSGKLYEKREFLENMIDDGVSEDEFSNIKNVIEELSVIIETKKIKITELKIALGVSYISDSHLEKFLNYFIREVHGNVDFSIRLEKRIISNEVCKVLVYERNGRETSFKTFESYAGYKTAEEMKLVENIINDKTTKKTSSKIDPALGMAEITKLENRMLMNKKQIEKIETIFRTFLLRDVEMCEDIEEQFNIKYNNFGDEKSDTLMNRETSDIVYVYGKKDSFNFQPQQIKAINVAEQEKAAILALKTGDGKTATGVAIAVKNMENNRLKKGMILVPKEKIADWTEEFYKVMKHEVVDGKIFSISSPKEFSKVYLDFVKADKGILILNYEMSKRIKLGDNNMDKAIDAVVELHGDIESEEKEFKLIKSKIKNAQELYEVMYSKAYPTSKGAKSLDVTFEESGINFIIADEAHRLKNLFVTDLYKESGIASGITSQISLDTYAKSLYLQSKNIDSHVYLLTATPFESQPLEIFAMANIVKQGMFSGISDCKDFIDNHINATTKVIENYDTRMKTAPVIESIDNLKTLKSQLGKYYFVTNEKTSSAKIPAYSIYNVEVSPGPEVEACLRDLIVLRDKAVSEALQNKQRPPILEYFSKFRSASNEMGLLYEPYRDESYVSNKMKALIDNVQKTFDKAPNSTQIIFSNRINYSSEEKDGSFLKKIKSVILNNIKIEGKELEYDEIAIISGETKEEMRQEIEDKFNAGEIKILLGGEKISHGINVQKKISAGHNWDIPWTPEEIKQRMGRLIRQGNENEYVEIFNYFQRNTTDAYLVQRIAGKESWINTLNESDSSVINFEYNNSKISFLVLESLVATLQKKEIAEKHIEREVLISTINKNITPTELKIKSIEELRIKYNSAVNSSIYFDKSSKNCIRKLELLDEARQISMKNDSIKNLMLQVKDLDINKAYDEYILKSEEIKKSTDKNGEMKLENEKYYEAIIEKYISKLEPLVNNRINALKPELTKTVPGLFDGGAYINALLYVNNSSEKFLENFNKLSVCSAHIELSKKLERIKSYFQVKTKLEHLKELEKTLDMNDLFALSEPKLRNNFTSEKSSIENNKKYVESKLKSFNALQDSLKGQIKLVFEEIQPENKKEARKVNNLKQVILPELEGNISQCIIHRGEMIQNNDLLIRYGKIQKIEKIDILNKSLDTDKDENMNIEFLQSNIYEPFSGNTILPVKNIEYEGIKKKLYSYNLAKTIESDKHKLYKQGIFSKEELRPYIEMLVNTINEEDKTKLEIIELLLGSVNINRTDSPSNKYLKFDKSLLIKSTDLKEHIEEGNGKGMILYEILGLLPEEVFDRKELLEKGIGMFIKNDFMDTFKADVVNLMIEIKEGNMDLRNVKGVMENCKKEYFKNKNFAKFYNELLKECANYITQRHLAEYLERSDKNKSEDYQTGITEGNIKLDKINIKDNFVIKLTEFSMLKEKLINATSTIEKSTNFLEENENTTEEIKNNQQEILKRNNDILKEIKENIAERKKELLEEIGVTHSALTRNENKEYLVDVLETKLTQYIVVSLNDNLLDKLENIECKVIDEKEVSIVIEFDNTEIRTLLSIDSKNLDENIRKIDEILDIEIVLEEESQEIYELQKIYDSRSMVCEVK